MKKNKIKILAMAGVLACSFGLVSCGTEKVTENKVEGEVKTIDKETLVYGSGDYTSINPAINEHGEINSLIFTGLTAHDKENKVIPALATQWDFDNSTNTYTFKLRDDVKWHDGTAFTADDVKFTIETIQNPDSMSEIASNYEDIKSVEVVSPTEVKITLEAPNVAMLDYLTVGMIPKHILDGKDIATSEFNKNPIGTGPYKLEKWDTGQSIKLVKNTDYFKGEPEIDNIVFKIVTDYKARAMQLKTGELDLTQITPTDMSVIEGNSEYEIYKCKTADYRGIMYNFNAPLFKNNPLLPNALSYAIDREAIIKTVLLGEGVSAYSPLQMGPYNNSEIEKFDYNPDMAKEELEKQGWSLDSDGIYEKGEEKLAFEIVCGEGDQVRIDMANICAQQFKQIGVNVTVKVNAKIDWANQDSYLIGWGSPFDPDDHTYKVFGTDKGANYNSYSNSKIDELLKAARTTDDDAKRLEYYKEFQEVMTEAMPYTYIAYIDAIYAADNTIKGISQDTALGHHGVGIFFNVDEWSIE
ncbi:MAG: ABC transporter substrate-binding protein [Sarcina sp.]